MAEDRRTLPDRRRAGHSTLLRTPRRKDELEAAGHPAERRTVWATHKPAAVRLQTQQREYLKLATASMVTSTRTVLEAARALEPLVNEAQSSRSIAHHAEALSALTGALFQAVRVLMNAEADAFGIELGLDAPLTRSMRRPRL